MVPTIFPWGFTAIKARQAAIKIYDFLQRIVHCEVVRWVHVCICFICFGFPTKGRIARTTLEESVAHQEAAQQILD